ncbi:MAG TPA: hypothetical protein VMR41_03430 [Patescibacteria group bacterium]|nr:hypothetical protein [Patescibacteria group bacterium]
MPNPLILSVIIKNPDAILYEGSATAVTSINEKGVFDILPEHNNFISVIKQHVIIHKPDKSVQEIPCREGVLRVENNVVKIFIDISPAK